MNIALENKSTWRKAGYAVHRIEHLFFYTAQAGAHYDVSVV